MGLKSIFARLLGRYGDDVLKYGDDVAKGVANSVDDVAKIPSRMRFVDIPDTLGKGTPYEGGILVTPTDPLWKYGTDFNTVDELVNTPKTINFLGHNDIDQTGFNPRPYYETVKIPETPINSLVREIDYEDGTDFIRPHKNTALGKWFEKKYASLFPPQPPPRFVEIDDVELPF